MDNQYIKIYNTLSNNNQSNEELLNILELFQDKTYMYNLDKIKHS